MKPPLPEAIDKFSILSLKLERIRNQEQIPSIKRELLFYKTVIDEYRTDGFIIKDEWLETLIEINSRIWDLEASVRQGKEQGLGLEEIGKRALFIREINKERIEFKNEIAREIGMDFFEVKGDHLSS